MTELSRWRATLNPFIGWIVRTEGGGNASEPFVYAHDDHAGAQDRADRLNRQEQYARIGVPDPTTNRGS